MCKNVFLTNGDNDKIAIMTGIIMTVQRSEHNQNEFMTITTNLSMSMLLVV